MEPQSESMKTGTTGTPARRASTSKPLRISISAPVRLTCPSGNTHTISPSFILRIASRRPSVAYSAESGITPLTR